MSTAKKSTIDSKGEKRRLSGLPMPQAMMTVGSAAHESHLRTEQRDNEERDLDRRADLRA